MSSFEAAVTCQQRGDLARAEAMCEALLAERPGHADGWHLRGLLAYERGQFERAIDYIERSLSIQEQQAAAHANVGCALMKLRRPAEALARFERSLALQANAPMTHQGRGAALLELSRCEEALAAFDEALRLAPHLASVLGSRGQALARLGRSWEALTSLQYALQVDPLDFDALYHLGNVLLALDQPEEALASYDRALKVRPGSVQALNNRGNALRELGRCTQALDSYQQVLQLQPTAAEAWSNRGNVLLDRFELEGALRCYETALRNRPDLAEALDNRGLVLQMLDRPAEAAASYARLLDTAPQYPLAAGNLLYARSLCCDWQMLDADRQRVMMRLDSADAVQPFALLAVRDCPSIQLQNAQRFSARWPCGDPPLWRGECYAHERLRVAYISADLRQHAVSFLMAGVFEQHDRAVVETMAVALRGGDGSTMAARVRAAFDTYIDAAGSSDRELAELLRSREVDVVVDLMGVTRGCRPGIFLRRPAPVQVGYLGFPGTVGAGWLDYLLADDFVIPPARRADYAEQVVYLPECFQANDDRCEVGPTPERAAVGLPEAALVLCCFNNSYKLNPEMFDIWMRVLQSAPDSVLWLLADREGMQANLLREAAARGIEARRLVFARSLPYAQHLGRLGLADLFLDTLPFNAGTTASDALRCGVPVLTCAGEAFAARMAGSLLRTVGLPELITFDLREYERRAMQLTRRRDALPALRARLAASLQDTPLFDTRRFCRHLEAAYRQMSARAGEGLPPAAFRVAMESAA